jgi:hypothetical protein
MKTKKAPADEAAERLAEIVEAHLDRMSPAERLDRLHALHQVAVKALAPNPDRLVPLR